MRYAIFLKDFNLTFFRFLPTCETLVMIIYQNGNSMLRRLSVRWSGTAFVYGYDDKIWGEDRVFFAEETLYYPHSDCEDRAILFSRIIRDIMGLQVVLVYYPGHLATAVQFNESIPGDYISVNGSHYLICDPTYINAPIGMSMPDMKTSAAKVILLD